MSADVGREYSSIEAWRMNDLGVHLFSSYGRKQQDVVKNKAPPKLSRMDLFRYASTGTGRLLSSNVDPKRAYRVVGSALPPAIVRDSASILLRPIIKACSGRPWISVLQDTPCSAR